MVWNGGRHNHHTQRAPEPALTRRLKRFPKRRFTLSATPPAVCLLPSPSNPVPGRQHRPSPHLNWEDQERSRDELLTEGPAQVWEDVPLRRQPGSLRDLESFPEMILPRAEQPALRAQPPLNAQGGTALTQALRGGRRGAVLE
ncbi:hypothetical protein CB1_001951016 [Camelus ferus]|nr:hypothetical protein CB1_001951016 [Camelus ferus]